MSVEWREEDKVALYFSSSSLQNFFFFSRGPRPYSTLGSVVFRSWER